MLNFRIDRRIMPLKNTQFPRSIAVDGRM